MPYINIVSCCTDGCLVCQVVKPPVSTVQKILNTLDHYNIPFVQCDGTQNPNNLTHLENAVEEYILFFQQHGERNLDHSILDLKENILQIRQNIQVDHIEHRYR